MPWGCRCRLIAARLTVSFEFVLDCVEASLCAGLVILRGRAADPDAADMHAAGSHDRKPALNHGDARQKGDPPGPPIRIAVGEIRRFACRAGRRSNGCGAKLLVALQRLINSSTPLAGHDHIRIVAPATGTNEPFTPLGNGNLGGRIAAPPTNLTDNAISDVGYFDLNTLVSVV
jgi:hypothetical protein